MLSEPNKSRERPTDVGECVRDWVEGWDRSSHESTGHNLYQGFGISGYVSPALPESCTAKCASVVLPERNESQTFENFSWPTIGGSMLRVRWQKCLPSCTIRVGPEDMSAGASPTG